MRSVVEIETEEPNQIKDIVCNSLGSDENIEYRIDTDKETIKIETVTDGLGALRGCTDTVFRLTTLAEKIYYR